MIKVLFIHHAADWGGASINLINIIKNLDRTKFRANVLIFKESIVSQKLAECNIPFQLIKSKFYKKFYYFFNHTIPSHTKWYRFDHLLLLILSWIFSRYFFAKKEISNEYDIIHLNSSILTDWLAPCSKVSKVVIHIQEPMAYGLLGLRYKFFQGQIRKYADHIIAISEDNAKRVNVPTKTTVIYNFVEIPKNKPLQEKYSSKTILYLGGAAYIKGFHILIESLAFLEPDIIVLLAGYFPKCSSNTIKDKLRYLFRRKRLIRNALKKSYNNKNVEYLGLITQLEPVFQKVCCLVSPFSIEHFSRPIIEAFAYYTPVIVSNIQGITEVVTHNYNGLIFNKNNYLGLANNINYLCKNPTFAKKLGYNGHFKAEQLYSQRNIEKIEYVYSLLLNK